MRAAIATSASPLHALRSRVALIQSRRRLTRLCLQLPDVSAGRLRYSIKALAAQQFGEPNKVTSNLQLPDVSARQPRCSIKALSAQQFGEPNKVTSNLNDIAGTLWDLSTKPLKELPWNKAESAVVEHLLIFSQKALKWSLIILFAVSIVSDISLAVSTNRELIIPLGLFIGVALSDFLKESSQEYFQNSIKDKNFARNLLSVGSFFMIVKFISLCYNMQKWLLLSHIGNGGLMQVLWLAKEMQQAEDAEGQEEQVLKD